MAYSLMRSSLGTLLPTDAALRRGISAAYYAVFHDLTEQAGRSYSSVR